MKKLLTLNFKVTPNARRETVDGVEYLIAPVVALVEGVLNGALCTAEAFQNTVKAWEGVPVPVTHPEDGTGAFVSAKDPAAAKLNIGTFRNVSWADGKLKGEVWLNVAVANANGYGYVLDQVEAGNPMEVSTGYFAMSTPWSGSHKGKAFDAIHSQVEPDHLALLPNEKGACSNEDGCGIFAQMGKRLAGFGQRLLAAASLRTHEISDGDKHQRIAAALAKESNDYHFIADVFEKFVVYEKTNDLSTMGKLFKRSYSVENDAVTLANDAEEVERKTVYQPVNNAQEATEMTRKEKVDALIANKRAAEKDRDHLLGLSDDMFAHVEKACGCPKTEVTPAPAAVAAPVVNAEDVAKLVKAQVDAALAANQAEAEKGEREKLSTLLVNSKKFTADELVSVPIGILRKMAADLATPSYGGRFLPVGNEAGEQGWAPSGEVIANRKEGN